MSPNAACGCRPTSVSDVVVLVGAPGSGKSTVGALLGRAARDAVHRRGRGDRANGSGKPVAEIFADDGEAVFRAFEEATTAELLAAPGVLALGGGAVLSEQTRPRWRASGDLAAGQRAPRRTRVGLNEARPLLLGNVRGRLIQLLAERTAAVRRRRHRDGRHRRGAPPSRSWSRFWPVVMPEPTVIAVAGEHPYEVLVGHGLPDRLRSSWGTACSGWRSCTRPR